MVDVSAMSAFNNAATLSGMECHLSPVYIEVEVSFTYVVGEHT